MSSMIKRAIAAKIQELKTKYPVISITGPRQSGKTTLAKDLFKEYLYLNLENLDVLLAAQTDPKSFLRTGTGTRIIIDEIQKYPQLFSYIQVEVDEQQLPAQFVITGSQQFSLNEKITQSLAGRVANFTLLPFSQEELVAAKQIQADDLYSLMLKGFYPKIYDKGIPPQDYYRDYLFTYVERDVRQLKHIGDLTNFQRFLQLVAGRVGQVVNLTSLGNDTGVSYKTISSWLSVLEASYIIFRLPPYFENYGKRIIKSPKIFFYDTGLLCHLLALDNSEELRRHFAVGSIFENFILDEIQKHLVHLRLSDRLYFWRDSNHNEIDVIIDSGSEQKGLEIKLAQTFSNDQIKGLNLWQTLPTKKPKKTYLIYSGELQQKLQQHHLVNWKNLGLLF